MKYIRISIILFLIIVVIIGISLFVSKYFKNTSTTSLNNGTVLLGMNKKFAFKQFKSDAEFKEYISNNTNNNSSTLTGVNMMAKTSLESAPSGVTGMAYREDQAVNDYSQTNVQVKGIDEPDILKTDGNSLFYSMAERYQIMPMMEKRVVESTTNGTIQPTRTPISGIQTINAMPVQNLKVQSLINARGDMLLSNNVLIVFDESDYQKRGVVAYDVSNKNEPIIKWNLDYKENTSKSEARLLHNKLYLITKTNVDISNPCPVMPYRDSKTLSVSCSQIYRPSFNTSIDSIFNVSIIDPNSGKVLENTSFIGSSNESSLYMSENALYISYYNPTDIVTYLEMFVKDNPSVFSQSIVDRISLLNTYDISSQSKMIELQRLLAQFGSNMDKDQRLVFENNLQNKLKDFATLHSRELEQSNVVKINAVNLKIEATGQIPGKVLNQFSMDEYDGNLRVASTIGQNMWFGQFNSNTESFSDVTVLNSNLSIIGSIKDLGKTERIYSARFIKDRGYLVTFRQTDPFYVLDLSNPNNPMLKGELKIPGYSSYLHPLSDSIIAGFGMENNNVKISLFDVSNAANPIEVDKYNLSEYWSEISSNHHAFLADLRNNYFFLPGGKGGYIFSYANNKLALIKAVSDTQVKRAAYINDNLYIVGDNGVSAFDIKTWNKLNSLQF
ncbi:MAG: beta-propeller domain-containing protein [bacterium]|nr:beta-propeller domain-containing protein [bacterium]